MSGGVDSSVAAVFMKEKGYDPIGVTMKLYDNEDINMSKEKTCCSLSDVEDARSVAYKVGFPYYVFNFKAEFKEKVIDKFVGCYMCGMTPNPCIDCNRYLKFEELYRRAKALGCDVIVTGHYARIRFDEATGKYQLMKGIDDSKDQSYVLYHMTQDQLAHTMFPLGEYTKDEIRKKAAETGLINADKHDSQDICFIPDGNHMKFIEEYTHKKVGKGNFLDINGKVIGQHNGYYRYTVGQRKGINVNRDGKHYVLEIRPETNEVVIGGYDESQTNTVRAVQLNFMSVEDLAEPKRVWAKIRYNHKGAWCVIEKTGPDEVVCTFDEPQRAVTPGQAVVWYDGEYVLGGGTITGGK